MLFDSIDFILFLPIVFLVYWFVLSKNLAAQNFFLIIASYVFYAWWDYRFLFLLMFSTFLDYFTGLKIHSSSFQRTKKAWLVASIGINLGFLGFFKYYNFFIESFAGFLEVLGFQANVWTLNVILPVGISFYTFHGLSYVLDVYYGRVKPTRNFVDYGLFVSYFPLLVAGPIERATHLLPQVQRPRTFHYSQAADGLRQILWGMFQKIVIADNCAEYANKIFDNYQQHNGITLFIGAVLFAFQIYGDFSGYSSIAIGVSRLFGIELLQNFSFPYFSRDIAEFWRRWHISLSSWFRDYLYVPLGGNKGGLLKKIRNTFIIFLVSGFWHGANWTFIAWGALNAIYFLPLLIAGKNRRNLEIVPHFSIANLLKIGFTFCLVCFAWIFFRSENITEAFDYFRIMFTSPSLHFPSFISIYIFLMLVVFVLVEWAGRSGRYALENIKYVKNTPARWAIYYTIVASIVFFNGTKQEFIYFQF
ncbi:MAG TPA: MBOAT family O-acyltransferase [Flavobacteriales bacterium]|nr:MBOAT family O-acyltransferase [Flavobacteriales bacterium]